jgi:hypothetical protein
MPHRLYPKWEVPVALFCLGTCNSRWLLLLLVGVFSKLRTATISFVISVCPHGTTWLPLDEISWNWYFMIFRKSVDKIQVWLQFDKDHTYFIRSSEFFLKWEMFQTKAVEKIKTQFYLFIHLFLLYMSNKCTMYDNNYLFLITFLHFDV